MRDQKNRKFYYSYLYFQAKVFGIEKLRGFAMSKQIGAILLSSGNSALKSEAKPAPKKLAGLEDFICQLWQQR